jgi:LEA14-like dessication related protein
MIGKIIVAVLVVLLVGAGVLFYLGKDLAQASVQSVELTRVEQIGPQDLVFAGILTVDNPSKLAIPVQRVTYKVVLDETNEVLATGEMPGFTIRSQGVSEIPFEHQTEFVPTASLAQALLTKQHVYVRFEGVADVGAGGVAYSLPFSTRMDVKQYLARPLTDVGIVTT